MGVASTVRFASFLGDNAFEFYRQIVAYAGEASGLPTEMIVDASAGMEALFGEERIEAAFGCGLLYVWKAAESSPTVRLMAAPVLLAARYHDQPVYFSDVVVHSDSPYQTFEDLRGATFAYNQAVSFSGCVLPRYHLLTLGATLDSFFGQTVATGSHAVSMNWVESGRAAAAAIDSVVLEMELAQRPERAKSFRVIASLGPAGMPPVIAAMRLGGDVHEQLTRALVEMHTTERGQAILRRGGVRRFARVTDRNYDDIRRMLAAVEQVG